MAMLSRLLLLTSLLLIPIASSATDFSKLYSKAKHAVVTLKTRQFSEQETEEGIQRNKSGSIGSGVLLKDGYIMTAAHVVHIADRIEVELADDRHFIAKPVSSIPSADLALLKLVNPPRDLPKAKLGNSDKLKIGEEVIVIGAPYGFSHTLTVGHFSGRRTQNNPLDSAKLEFLQTDAPINRGNSGGPMFNTKGEIIGIVSHIRSSTGGNEGLGFAASINMAKELLLNEKAIWSGMEFVPLSPTLAKAINSPTDQGILVQEVAYNSLADQLGIRPSTIPANVAGREVLLGGDILISVGSHSLSLDDKSIQLMRKYLSALEPGNTLQVTVFRQGRQVILESQIKSPL